MSNNISSVLSLAKQQSSTLRHKHSDMFSSTQAQHVSVYLDSQDTYFHDLEALINLKVDDVAVLKVNTLKSPCLANIRIVDLKLNVYGPKEDEMYAMLPILVKNIRRGNTIL